MPLPPILLSVFFVTLLIVATVLTGGQGAVSLSRKGQEDLTFWVNHNGLLQYDVEGEVGFGDMARILLRRRLNGEAIRPLRHRFTFRVRDIAALRTGDLIRAQIKGGVLAYTHAPQRTRIAAASRTYNLPVVVLNHDAEPRTVKAAYHATTMQSRVEASVPAGGAAALFLRSVETEPGKRSGSLALNGVSTSVAFEVRPLVPLRVQITDEAGQSLPARVYLTAFGRTRLCSARQLSAHCRDAGRTLLPCFGQLRH